MGTPCERFPTNFCIPKPLARARPGHPRLGAATISPPKTWMPTDLVRGLKAHGQSPATGILSGCTGSWARNSLGFPGQPCRGRGIGRSGGATRRRPGPSRPACRQCSASQLALLAGTLQASRRPSLQSGTLLLPRHTGEGRCPWLQWVPAFAGMTNYYCALLGHLRNLRDSALAPWRGVPPEAV